MKSDTDPPENLREAPVIDWTVTRRDLGSSVARPVDFQPDPDLQARVADFLGLRELSHWRIRGTLSPEGDDAWRLKARMTANAVQSCVVTLDPVPQKIDTELERLFVPEDGPDALMTEDIDLEQDDEIEVYGDILTLGSVALEALALELDPYPRSTETSEVNLSAAPPGIAPLTDEAMRPFAALSALKAKLEGEGRDE